MNSMKDFALRIFGTLLAVPFAYLGYLIMQHQSSSAFDFAVLLWILCVAWIVTVWRN